MSAIANLVNEPSVIIDGEDAVVIRHYGYGYQGGRTLDVTGFTGILRAGHVIIREVATNKFKPMPVNGKNYATLPVGCEYVGVLVASVPVSEPFAAIMYDGEVNDVASPYPVDSIKAAMKTALPKLVFLHD